MLRNSPLSSAARWKYVVSPVIPRNRHRDCARFRGHVAWYHQFIDVIAAKYPAISRVVHYEEMIASPLKTRAEVAGLCGLETAGGPMPGLGDDRGCAAPYLVMMN